MRRLYLFDIDGTLIGSPRGVGRRAFEQACLDVARLEGALAGVILHGNTDPSILEEAFLGRLGRRPTEEEGRLVLAAYVERLREELLLAGAVRLLPQVEETLRRAIASGAMVGLATGNIEAGARLKLERVGLWESFVAGGHPGWARPTEEARRLAPPGSPIGGFGSDAGDRAELVRVAIRRAAARAGEALPAERIWVIGDTPRDIAAAHAAGVRAVGVATGMHDAATLVAAGADEVHETLATFAPR